MSDNNRIAAFFDELASEWGNSPQDIQIRQKIVEMAEIPANSVIADIGCGRGVMSEHLLSTSPKKIIGIDLSSKMIEFARQDCTDNRIEFINTDLLTADLPEIDAAIIFNSYPHFLDKKSLAEKLAKHIKKGGILVIAHSRSKQLINGGHASNRVMEVSVTLDTAENEAKRFLPFFSVDTLIDNEIYFIKMSRN